MAHIQFGFCMPADNLDKAKRSTYLHDLKQALGLVTGYFDSAWIIDHLQFGNSDILEGFTTLAFTTGLYPQLKFGHTVLCQSFRNPALLAKMGATLQFLSGGRFILGLGAGWHKEEYQAYGYAFPPSGVRVSQLEETVQIIKAMWTKEKATFEGKYHHIVQAYCEPKPQPLPPIMIGAIKPKMLRVTAKYADWWNVSSLGIEGYRKVLEECERACYEVGRDPITLKRTWVGGCACAPSQVQAEAFAGNRYSAENVGDDFGFVGTPEQVIMQMRAFINMGVDYFILDCGGFPQLTTLQMLVSKVLPELNNGK